MWITLLINKLKSKKKGLMDNSIPRNEFYPFSHLEYFAGDFVNLEPNHQQSKILYCYKRRLDACVAGYCH